MAKMASFKPGMARMAKMAALGGYAAQAAGPLPTQLERLWSHLHRKFRSYRAGFRGRLLDRYQNPRIRPEREKTLKRATKSVSSINFRLNIEID